MSPTEALIGNSAECEFTIEVISGIVNSVAISVLNEFTDDNFIISTVEIPTNISQTGLTVVTWDVPNIQNYDGIYYILVTPVSIGDASDPTSGSFTSNVFTISVYSPPSFTPVGDSTPKPESRSSAVVGGIIGGILLMIVGIISFVCRIWYCKKILQAQQKSPDIIVQIPTLWFLS